MLEIANLTKRFGARTALCDLTMSVAPGEVYALLGPNGAGKSTTIGCILGFVAPDSGRITIGDGSLPVAEAAIAHAAYISENVALYEKLTGVENVSLFLSLQGKKPNVREIEAMLNEADVPQDAWHRLAETYSKGMRQKVGVVMALAKGAVGSMGGVDSGGSSGIEGAGARLLVLDEPTSGLDPLASVAFGKLIRKLASNGTAVLMATHDLFRAQEMADRCGMLVDGRLVGEWKRESLSVGELERVYLSTLTSLASGATPN
jgi:ABC-2 type transport system ATP-binding protein